MRKKPPWRGADRPSSWETQRIMEGPTSIPKGRKRPSSMSAEGQAQKKFQDDCCANETGTEEAVVYATPPLVRQGTFTKNDCDADQEASQDRHAEQFYILVEQAGSTTRGEVLRRRLADRAAQISEGSRKARTERRAKEAQTSRRTQQRGTLSSTSRGGRGYCRTQGSSSASCRSSRGGGRVNSSPKSATPSPPQLQRQGTFTVDEEDADSGGRRSGTEEPANPTDTAPDQGAEVRPETVIQSESHIPDAEVDPRPGGSACSAFSGGDTVAAVTASESNMAETECSNLSSVAELRAALAALRRGRAAAERSERAARERAARDAAKTRAALQDLQARLAATREALLSEKDALNRKLSAGFRKALHDRESLWRQDRERTQAQVRTLEAEARSLRAQLHSAHAQAHADAQRKATANEADLRRACHDQESSLRSQVAELVKQRDSLQAQLRDRAAHDATERFRDDDQWRRALRREQQEARRKQAILQQQLTEVQQALARSARSAPVTCGTDLAFSLHNNEECERKLSEAASRQQALEDELQAALRALHAQDQGDSRFQSKQVALALETHGEGEREGREGGMK